MSAHHLWILSLAAAALGVALLATALVRRLLDSSRIDQRIEALQRAEAAAAAARAPLPGLTPLPGSTPPAANDTKAMQALARRLTPPAWLDSALARTLLADEDRQLLDQAGIELARGGLAYVAARAALGLVLPLLALMILRPHGTMALIEGFLAFGTGLMLPKWVVRSRAERRRRRVVEELPLFVDLLRLLQGVGLSVDQSLHILATEFGSVLRVISRELALANQLYSSGRTRGQSLQRLAHLGADDDMAAVVNLLVQVERHGGAVQEPLRDFSLRLREKRQAGFKEKIGHITVKMTGVMVLTLLPALLVITAGPGFTAVIRSLSSLGGR